MSVLVKGMEIPTKQTTLTIFPNGYVAIYDAKDSFVGETRCVQVPPHGDLIDYEFCMKNYELLHDDDGNPVYAVRMRDINSAPIIIPAEEGE